ncbi:MMPL family transporter, partial [Phytoactinopolyspora endophytica]|uniref:MMPL family transporter n=1 Tax=Phytoactinopolyspora endophytica TaxID=1642495 RepID=UPI00197C9865
MASTTLQPRPSRLQQLAGWAQRHHWLALVVWVLLLVGVTAASGAVGDDYHDDHTLPGTESQELNDRMEENAPAQSGDSIQIVVNDEDGLADAGTQDRIESMLDEVGALPHVAGVTSPYESAQAISEDGTIGYATVALDAGATDVPSEAVEDIIDTAQAAGGDGLQVELSGDAVRNAEESEGGGAEGAGMLAALVILVFMFGSFLAASLPVITAIFAVGSTLGVVILASNLTTIASYTPPLMMLVGLGVGIDYALLIFARYRGELLRGSDRQQAARTALDT